MDITCSLRDCQDPILGRGILLKDQEKDRRMFENAQDVFSTYVLDQGGRNDHTLILHPKCFLRLFDLMLYAEDGRCMLTLILATTEDFRVSLDIP